MDDRPKIVKHLISIGFVEIIGEWKMIWGQGDGWYWDGKLKRGDDIIFTDRDTTLYKYALNGIIKTDDYFMALT